MKIKLLAFGISKDILGQRELEVNLPGPTDVKGLLAWLSQQYPEFERLASLRVAVNDEYAQPDHKIEANNEVVLIPPVSGG
jgi:molybdopterin converting factor subunit 1